LVLRAADNRRHIAVITGKWSDAMASSVPDTPDVLLTRRDAAAALTAAGYPVARATLATLATRGGGPAYRRFGSRPLYLWSDLLVWAEGRLSPRMRSTSEADAA
jgi:hypothetical protein